MIAFLLAFVLGVLLATLSSVSPAFVLLLLCLSGVLALLWRRGEAPSRPVFILSVCLLGLALGCLRFEAAHSLVGNGPLAEQLHKTVEIEGVVVRDPSYRERTVQLIIEYEDEYILVSADRALLVSYGDVVNVSGKLVMPENFVSAYGREFDYRGYLLARGIEYRISFAEVTVVGAGAGNPVITWLLMTKAWFVDQLEQIIPEPAVGLGKGLLLGIDGALGADIEADFRRTGIIHIVVLSGYNVMLVVAFILFVFSFFLPFRWRLGCGFVAIVAFALIVGLSATVVRASIMASLVLLADLIGRRYDVLRALLFAGVLMILVNPYILVYDVGFQLSFMATLGLILIVPHFETRFASVAAKRWKLSDFLFATLATQIAVLPLLMYHIGEVSLIAVVVNVLVLPLVPVAMLLTFATGLLGAVSTMLASLAGFLATLVLSLILSISAWFALVPFAAIVLPPIPAWSMIFMYGAMAGFFLWGTRRRATRDTSDVSDWTIETETTDPNSGSVAQAETVPIFFR